MKNSEREPVLVKMVTSLGDIRVSLFFKEAPNTALNFLENVKSGLYTGGVFYRAGRRGNETPANNELLSVIQGGRNQTYKPRSPIPLEPTSQTGLTHRKFVISMARQADPNSGTTEFFICTDNNEMLDSRERDADWPGFAVFGEVVEGFDVVDRIHRLETGNRKLSDYEKEEIPLHLLPQMLTESVEIIEIQVDEKYRSEGEE